jgi:signal transduction histidine kinase
MDGTHLNEFQKSLLETVKACGRTLLDTMNQVLDFSKIVSLEKSWRQMKRSREQRDIESPKAGDPTKGVESMAALLDTNVPEDIALLVEEVVEGVYLSHTYARSTAADSSHRSTVSSRSATSLLTIPDREDISRPDVEVVVDIEEGDWVFRTQPGALRRIVMNIFGNSMKYTERGRVSLRLQSIQADAPDESGKEPRELVLLTVSDTGKGISEDFLRARLYTPFAQEDTLAVGTGLGLAIVRSIVKSLGGHISIKSHAGEGTVVTVSLPLGRPSPEEVAAVASRPFVHSQDMLDLRAKYAEKTVAIMGFDPNAPNDAGSAGVIARYVADWFGLKMESWPTRGSVDILLAQDYDLVEDTKRWGSCGSSALIVLCSTAVDYDSYRRAWSAMATSIDFLHRPCGPHKLARSILRCLRQLSTPVSPQQLGIQHPPLADRTRSMESSPDRPVRLDAGAHLAKERLRGFLDRRHDSEPQTPTLSVPKSPPTPDASSSSQEASSQVADDEGVVRPASAAPAAPGPHLEIAPAPPPPADGRRQCPINVLVVDDNQINLRLLLTYLNRRNIGVLDSAENGKMAVEAVEKRPEGYDIIFMGKLLHVGTP